MLKRLRQLRIGADMTQRQLARLLGVNLSTYCRYECGNLGMDVGKLTLLADFYQVSLDYLIRGADGNTLTGPTALSVAFVQKYNKLNTRSRKTIDALLEFEYRTQVNEKKLNSNLDDQV